VIPGRPTGLRARPISPHRVLLSWQGRARRFDVYRDGAIAYQTSGTTLSDRAVKPGEVHTYTVVAVNEHGPSAPSLPLTLRLPDADLSRGAPEAPTGLRAQYR
jgi:hypothetical protein